MKKIQWMLISLLAMVIINYPNPFNPKGGQSATFECTSDSSFEAMLYLYDFSARLVWHKAYPLKGGTTSRLSWNGYGDDNKLTGNGMYLYRVVENSTKSTLGKGKVWIINR